VATPSRTTTVAPAATSTRVNIVLGSTPRGPGPRQLPRSGGGGVGSTTHLATIAIVMTALGAAWGGIYLASRRR
jgi:hypothetical protein